MGKRLSLFILLTLAGTLTLFPNFYDNKWGAVEKVYYDEWQIRYDRLVVARLVKNRQDGFFSAGGLLGLGDTDNWSYKTNVHHHQFDAYINNKKFESYLIYKSNPGFQGVLYGAIDNFLNIDREAKLRIFRGITATASALTFGMIFAFIMMEFGFLAGALMLIFSTISIWTVLPAGTIFWNFWVFFLPTFVSTTQFSRYSQREKRINNRFYAILCLAMIVRILLSGFDLMTAVLIMATVPILYFAVLNSWAWREYLRRFIAAGISLTFGTTIGLLIMGTQISSVDGQVTGSLTYIISRVGKHFAGNTDYYTDGTIEATKVGVGELILKYMHVPAFNLRLPGPDLQVQYWHILLLFVIFTFLFFIANGKRHAYSRKSIALISATWFSILAPLSWILIFRPHSIIHTHVNSMGWQMPFTLLGFALSGHVITDLFKRRTT